MLTTCPTCGMEEENHKCPMAPPHYIQEIEKLKAENARLAAALQDSVAREWPTKTALRDLLKPTVELLRCMDDFVAGSRLCPSRLSINAELSRLEALTK